MSKRTQQPAMPRRVWVISWATATLLLAACAQPRGILNSDRIAARYGSYFVEVLRQDETQRVSSLASLHDERLITRTFAVSYFAKPQAAFEETAAKIRAGASIGSSFREAGWTIAKETLFVGSVSVSAREQIIGTLMDVALPRDLAMHVYRFTVARSRESFEFATIVELHHPDFLALRDLRRIYGSSSLTPGAEIAARRESLTATILALSSLVDP